MGCDIYLYTEVKTVYGWRDKTLCVPSNLYDSGYEYIDFWNGRNYKLFALLADVRNYEDIKPISLPRGLPADLSDGLKREFDELDRHSCSWYLLSELLNFDWSKYEFLETWQESLEFIRQIHNNFSTEKIRIVFGFGS